MTTTITLEAIRKHGPCAEGWATLLAHLGKTAADDEPLELIAVLENNDLSDALWCLRALPESMDNAVRLLVCDLVEPAMAFVPEGETRPQAALAAARAFARGEITAGEVNTAGTAAWEAGTAARAAAAGDTARASWAARAAARAAGAAARAARAAARAAWASDAAEAAGEAAWAARTAAWAAGAARERQEIVFRTWLKEHQI